MMMIGEQECGGRIARDEVGFFFSGAEATMGLHAQAIGDGGGGTGWDEARAKRAHAQRHSVAHRAGVDKVERIRATLNQLSREHRHVLEKVYTSFGWNRFGGVTEDATDRTNWEIYTRFLVEGVQLLPLVLESPELLTVFYRAHPERDPDVEPVVFVDLMGFVQCEVGALAATRGRRRQPIPMTHRLYPALRAAAARERAALHAYDSLRRTGRRAAREFNTALHERSRLASEKRDRDLFERQYGIRLEPQQ